ncbi:hypothetical protein M9H77_21061 [Catharanthus roseus]|uniref:Uncharacterized protein n=1 Tax=Catharanthus roseus TaxID=4058 RepID=A0ACC0AL94_CATRO|nr:hypothetical protein M9H77_21061 [Catharanthus roseus]
MVVRGLASTPRGLAGEDERGLRTIGTVCPTASPEGTIETGSPILTDKQLMFEAAGGSNKGLVYSFNSQSAAVTAERQGYSSSFMSSIPSVSSAAGHKACIKREGGCEDTCSRHMRSSLA